MADFSFYNQNAGPILVAVEPWAMACSVPPGGELSIVYDDEDGHVGCATFNSDGSITIEVYALTLPEMQLDGVSIF